MMLHYETSIDVRFYELDPYNHLNHTNYLAYCEVARVEALESVGIGLPTLAEKGFQIVVTDITGKFLAPVSSGEHLDVITDVVAIGRASYGWEQRIDRGGDTVFTLSVRAAMTDMDGTPTRVPDFVKVALS